MAVLKCKMCGGTLDVQEGMTVCECEYCGSKQTIPTVDNEKKMKLFDRANRLRINCEFDKAGSVYESIIEEFPEEAEGYWGNLLCKYGIEYVDDPATGDKVPTCHRSSFESFMDDEDFELVMENADAIARGVYREQAKQIEEIRKGIVEVSAHEQPYDIFICYKETDENGDRTLDSVLAQDVYDALTDKGYRVFFSRISLEDKLGTEYEPYIFAALNSAKIMLAFGTNYDYYNAVWVKNEWSRFLRLMAKDKTKHLIPCYKDIDAYDIPKEFTKLQAQDMGKVGAGQDLLRGIDKLMGRNDSSQKKDADTQTIIQQVSGGPSAISLIDRGNMSLEDGENEEAIDFFNRALDIDSKSAEAYLGLFMASIKVKNKAAAKDAFISGDYISDKNWSRAKQFASAELSEELLSWEDDRNARMYRQADESRLFQEEITKIRTEIENLEKRLKEVELEMTAEEQAESSRLQSIANKACEAARQAEQDFETCKEKQEVSRLADEIRSKEERMKGLGIFKGREKKELQTQIDTLKSNLIVFEKKVEERKRESKRIKEEAEQALKNAVDYKTAVIDGKVAAITKKKVELNRKLIILQTNRAVPGDFITFGHYAYKDVTKPIEWQVLEKKNNQLFIISRYSLDEVVFCEFENRDKKKWRDSSIRSWLNRDFLSKAFTDAEEGMIEETTCTTSIIPEYPKRCEATTDKVFLLSISEVNMYFPTNNERRSLYYSLFTLKENPEESPFSEKSWWLRSPGKYGPMFVEKDGTVSYDGFYDPVRYLGVRPALWINLES